MKRYIILFFVFATVSVFGETTIEQANEAYSSGDFSKAIQLYETIIINEKGISADVCYNLGNAYYRLNKIAPSILNYERSILLNPKNKDAHFNLEIAKLKTVDKIEPIGTFFLIKWYNAIENLYNVNQWSGIGISCFLLFVVCLFLFFFSSKIQFKKIGFYIGLVLLKLCIVANIFAYNRKRSLTHHNTAIIFAPTITVKSSPDDSGTDLFILHEGSKVKIKNKLGEWNEIETAAGDIGWIKGKEIETI